MKVGEWSYKWAEQLSFLVGRREGKSQKVEIFAWNQNGRCCCWWNCSNCERTGQESQRKFPVPSFKAFKLSEIKVYLPPVVFFFSGPKALVWFLLTLSLCFHPRLECGAPQMGWTSLKSPEGRGPTWQIPWPIDLWWSPQFWYVTWEFSVTLLFSCTVSDLR